MWHDIRMLNAITNALLGMLALSLLASGAWWFAQRPMFALEAIRVESAQDGGPAEGGLRHVSALTIKHTALPRIRGNFFTADLDAVREAFEAVPWVRKAMVRREWPNRLIVSLEEHEPLGTWGEDGRLLSLKGEVFTANLAEAEEEGALPEFDGPEGSAKEVLAFYRRLTEWLAPIGLKPASLRLSGRYAWTVGLDNGMRVELGREQDSTVLKKRVDRLVGVYPELAARLQDGIESVDMRYPNGLALKAHGLKLGLNGKKK